MAANPLQLTVQEIEEFFSAHLPHRLTLLRAFRYRLNWGGDWQGTGDIYRCLKDSALISVRLFFTSDATKRQVRRYATGLQARAKEPKLATSR